MLGDIMKRPSENETMNVMHRISLNSDKRFVQLLKDCGFPVQHGTYSAFEIGENDPRWNTVEALCRKFPSELGDFQYYTDFTKEELETAEYYVMLSEWHFGYPQPEDGFAYEHTTYKADSGCRECGVGLVQAQSFSVRKQPAWRAKSIAQLNWVFDEFFVSSMLKRQLMERNLPIQFMDVLKYPKGTPFDDMFQIVIDRKVDIDSSLLIGAASTCPVCGRMKYPGQTRGFFPEPEEKDFLIARTGLFFGSGHAAHNYILISKEMYTIFKELKVKGVSYVPCKK